MRVDAHQHYWHYDPRSYAWIGPGMELLARDWLPDQIHADMVAADIDVAIAVQARGDEADTAFLLDLAARNRRIAGVVGWVDLKAADCGQRIARWRAQGPLVGLRHQIQDEADPAAWLNDPAFTRGVQQVQHDGLVYELLLQGRQLASAAEFCARHDRHVIVLDHLGKPAIGDPAAFASWRVRMHALAQLPHVVAKLSGLVTEARDAEGGIDASALIRYLDVALELFGPHRLLFGSDWPVCLLAMPYGQVHSLIKRWATRLPPHEQSALFGGNALTIYGNGLRLA